MKINLTGITDDGGFVNLSPGRYSVVTKGEWSAKISDNGNMVLRVPFTVQDKGEFEGAASSYFHTIMLDGPADKLRTNKVFTFRLLASLGLISEADQGPKGELEVEFEYGDKGENERVAVLSLVVNGQKRSLGNRPATAVVVLSDSSQSGVQVKALEANGKPSAPTAARAPNPAPSTEQSAGAQRDFPF
jgi:hypothetical protein